MVAIPKSPIKAFRLGALRALLLVCLFVTSMPLRAQLYQLTSEVKHHSIVFAGPQRIKVLLRGRNPSLPIHPSSLRNKSWLARISLLEPRRRFVCQVQRKELMISYTRELLLT